MASRKAEVIEGQILNVSVFCPVAVIDTLAQATLRKKRIILTQDSKEVPVHHGREGMALRA